MQETDEQRRVQALIAGSDRNLIVEAVAGAGKTTTLVEAIRRMPVSRTCLFCAFNRHVAEELKERLSDQPVTVGTLHSVGWEAVRRARPGTRLDQHKTARLLASRDRRTASEVVAAVSLLKGAAVGELRDADLEELTERHGLDPALYADVRRVWNTEDAAADFDDMIWLPATGAVPVPRYDVVFVDEAQDLNLCQMRLAARLGRRVIAVGDRYQAIYGFRGACPDALDRLRDQLDAVTAPLSVCFRCAPEIVTSAQRVVPVIRPLATASGGTVGSVKLEEMMRQARPGDWVLCRTSAPLLQAAMGMVLDRGQQVRVKGVDLAHGLAHAVAEEGEEEAREVDQDRVAVPSKPSVARSLLRACPDMVRRVRDGGVNWACVKDPQRPVTFSTIHRAKGLEADRVFVMRPDLLPHPNSTRPWELAQESNLWYVAVTRARRNLTFVV